MLTRRQQRDEFNRLKQEVDAFLIVANVEPLRLVKTYIGDEFHRAAWIDVNGEEIFWQIWPLSDRADYSWNESKINAILYSDPTR